jgi:4-carboxymuconolactone decarboxylase
VNPEQLRPPSLAQDRASSGEVPPERLAAAQADAAEEFRRLRGVEPFGPFIDLLASPELMTRVSALGEYLRYRSSLAPRLSEFAILITAAHWKQQYEWDVHEPIALQAGVPQKAIDALRNGERPARLDDDRQALYDVCTALHSARTMTHEHRRPAEATLGEQQVMDAIAICGYYALLAMVLNSRLGTQAPQAPQAP